MLSAGLTCELLADMNLNTGNKAVDTVIESLVHLYLRDLCQLLDRRDKALFGWQRDKVLSDERLELLSEIAINVDAKLSLIPQ